MRGCANDASPLFQISTYSAYAMPTKLVATYLCVELVTVGVPDALQLLVAAIAAAVVSVVLVDLHQVEEEPREGVGVTLREGS